MSGRSSTSSSNDRLPTGGWPRTWFFTALLVLVPLLAWEGFWRARGFQGHVEAADESWMLAFRRVPQASAVVLGTSRIGAALDPDAWRSVMGGSTPVNLCLPGNSPLPLLEFLADSTGYRGLVLVEILPLFAFDGTRQSERRGLELLRRYRRDEANLAKLAENWLRVHVMRHFVFRAPELLPARVVGEVRQGRMPTSAVMALRPDRFGPVNQRPMTATRPWDPVLGFLGVDYPIAERTGRPATLAEYAELTGRLNRSVDRILYRGGRVVLLYMPACGGRRVVEERRYPRAQYWEPLTRATRAIAIAAEDHPALMRFDCFDGSHIDAADAPTYAKALAEVVRDRLAAVPAP